MVYILKATVLRKCVCKLCIYWSNRILPSILMDMLAVLPKCFFSGLPEFVGGSYRHGISNTPPKRSHKGPNWVNALATLNRPSMIWGALGCALSTQSSMPLKYEPLLFPAKTMCALSVVHQVVEKGHSSNMFT